MRCVILCGGKGERLMPLTKSTKKAYLPLGQKRVIDHIIDRIPRGMPYSISLNDNGALAALEEAISGDEPIMVICGDNYFSENLGAFASAFEGKTMVGIYDIGDKERAKQYGVVELSPEGQILRLIEKPQHPDTTLVSLGLYVFPPQTFPLISDLAAINLKGNLGLAIIHIMTCESVYGFLVQGTCFDIGTPWGYLAANKFENQRLYKVSEPMTS